ncbi:DinB family protein [Mesohalobacter halotolerans]|uniref:DinB family protein n=1 Tax=Mesohalobacter halotolerans TaxID=1883405 RepID=A0A4U5TR24_9FLAO|nr:DinB family protein [Mesohalobacter halotolerans]MBS3739269.1 DinB family protein [Psychroflexus sp.]TKS56680.1 DinB family protein [Mesohalobacter halotolerans]
MVENCIDNLKQIKDLTQNISEAEYRHSCRTLFNSSIGQHIRHSLEFYICLFKGLESNIVNYDERERQHDLESQPEIALKEINKIINQLKAVLSNQNLEVKANYTSNENDEVCMHSSLYRELGFCLEHCVHHQALVKTGLKELDCLHLVDQSFGVAPSTLRNQSQCAQ